MHDDDTCKVELKLQDIHLWAHACLRALKPDDLHRAHAVGEKILDMLNELPDSNPIKFLAMFEVISVGADVLDHTMYRVDSTATVH